jgi:hypothetical protein
MEIRKTHSLCMEPVDVRRLEDGIAVTGQIAIALIVGQDENDIRGFAGKLVGCTFRNDCRRSEGEDTDATKH